MEEKSKAMAGTRYENQRRELDKSLKARQESLKAKHRQGGCDELMKTLIIIDVKCCINSNISFAQYLSKATQN